MNKINKRVIFAILTAIILIVSALLVFGSTDENASSISDTSNATNNGTAIDISNDGVDITSLNAATNESIKNENTTNAENTSISSNETTKAQEKSITLNLQYKADSPYDTDNNGYESTIGVIDFVVDNSAFSWDVNKTNLCTRWKVYSVDSQESTTICYGNSKCCNFVDLEHTRDNWDAPFYSIYGEYENSLNTIVSAQILYVDYSINAEKPYEEIYYSNWQNLTADYYFASIDFENVCVDTCYLNDFSSSNYTLVFEINNSVLTLDKINYLIAEEIGNVSFVLTVKDNKDADSGTYQLYKDGTLVLFEGDLIRPDYYDIEINPLVEGLNKLIIKNADITEPVKANIGLGNASREISVEDVNVTRKYSINLEKMKFKKAVLKANSSGNSLFKCRQWDFEGELCFGAWEKVQNLIEDQEYEIILDAESNGFIEGNSNTTLSPPNATLNITNTTLENITNLILLINISNITIASGSNVSINLSQHFLNADNTTIFSYYKPENISIFFENGTATIVPDNSFAGVRYTFIVANKSNSLVVSNLFSVSVEYKTRVIPTIINITDPAAQLKLKEYADINLKSIFKYNTIYFTSYEIKNEIVVVYAIADDKNIKWLTSLKNFNEITLPDK